MSREHLKSSGLCFDLDGPRESASRVGALALLGSLVAKSDDAGFCVVWRGSSGIMGGGEGGVERAERVAFNEVTFRRANEMIGERAEELAVTGRVPFVCECGDASCLERVELSLAEYEGVREDARCFLVAPGHAITGPDLGRVIRSETRYGVVEKIGLSGEIAEARDPRSA